MAYEIIKSDGTSLITLPAGSVDDTTTSLTLFGKGFKDWGEGVNTNFVHLMENFASVTPPTNPLNGQIWYNSGASQIAFYDAVQTLWRPLSTNPPGLRFIAHPVSAVPATGFLGFAHAGGEVVGIFSPASIPTGDFDTALTLSQGAANFAADYNQGITVGLNLAQARSNLYGTGGLNLGVINAAAGVNVITITGAGNVNVANNLVVGSAASVANNLSVGGSLSVTGVSNFTGNVALTNNLTVNGQTNVQNLTVSAPGGWYRLPNNAGTSGQFLQTNGVGNFLTWESSPIPESISNGSNISVTTSAAGAANNIIFRAGGASPGTERMRIIGTGGNAGNVNIGTVTSTTDRLNIAGTNGGSNLPRIRIINSTSNGLSLINAEGNNGSLVLEADVNNILPNSELGLNVDNTRVLTARTSGVAIGTNTDPRERLDVDNGTVRISAGPHGWYSLPEAGAAALTGAGLIYNGPNAPMSFGTVAALTEYIHLRDTGGATSITAGAWRNRNFDNPQVINTIPGATFSLLFGRINRINLPQGTYMSIGGSAARQCNGFQTRLIEVDASNDVLQTLILGQSCYSRSGGTSGLRFPDWSMATGRFTLGPGGGFIRFQLRVAANGNTGNNMANFGGGVPPLRGELHIWRLSAS